VNGLIHARDPRFGPEFKLAPYGSEHPEPRFEPPTPITTEITNVVRECRERMLHAGLADLLEALVVRSTATHAIQVLRYHRVIVLRVRKPVKVFDTEVT
jgi:hypothetical protein